jgi:hypothetical protein
MDSGAFEYRWTVVNGRTERKGILMPPRARARARDVGVEVLARFRPAPGRAPPRAIDFPLIDFEFQGIPRLSAAKPSRASSQ